MASVRDLVSQLDALFDVERFAAAEPFRTSLAGLYGPGADRLTGLLPPGWAERGNGLLLQGEGFDRPPCRVACAVFPSGPVLAGVLAAGSRWPVQLLVLHHPACYRTRRGWAPVPPDVLQALGRAGVSIYAVHTPLDLHPRFGVSLNLSRHLGFAVDGPFYETAGPGSPCAGVVASPPQPLGLAEFCRQVRRAVGVTRLDVLRHGTGAVRRVAVVAGGGHTLPGVIQRCVEERCDTYLTGTVVERVPNERWQRSNAAFLAEAASKGVNLVGASHCATEKFGLLALAEHLKGGGWPAEFLPCPRPWG
ncbi:MAG: Nif3-like dinuclear metal center hexameric protein [Acetobacteraceae bacterium]|nr:Nif3-like dinuclear metal center hexameric protein [Acetobacteraceae bacterium]